MKNLYFLLVIASLLTACAAPAAGQLEPTSAAIESTLPVITSETAAPTATIEPTLTPTPEPEPQWVAFIGNDGNVRMVDRLSGELRNVTTDSSQPAGASSDQVLYQYWGLKASSDGQLLAFRRDIGTPHQEGYSYSYEVWVYWVATGESKLLLANQATVGMDWKPGTHLLAYAVPPEEGYFTGRAQYDLDKARGIWAVDVDSGENMELVSPHGYSIANPSWSPDGRYIAFEEIWNMEGSGYVAFYDFETGEYTTYAEALGMLDWSPDSQRLAYDMLTYTASGSEQIFLRPLKGGEDLQVAPDYEQGYTYSPRFSPSGGMIAYLFHNGDPESLLSTVQVQLFDSGEVRSLGDFENPTHLGWLPDESGLIVSVGPYGTRQVMEISLLDGSVRVLAEGEMAVVLE